MNAPKDGPERTEVEEQLGRILESKTFTKYPKGGLLLERLVKDSLDGHPRGNRYEEELARDLFKKRKNWKAGDGSAVREPMRRLRGYLRIYYGREGTSDNVEISFPKHSGYAAYFSHRAREEEKDIQSLSFALDHVFPDLLRSNPIVRAMQKCITDRPADAATYGIVAEATLAYAMCDETYSCPAERALPWVENAVEDGMKLDQNEWRLHVMAGAIHCCHFAWDRADAAFKKALRLAPDETRGHFWYAAFLLAVGRTEEVSECVSFARTRPLGRLAPYIGPLFLYVMRQYEDAYNDLISLRRNPLFAAAHLPSDIVPSGLWPAELLLGCLLLELNEPKEALKYAEAGVTHSMAGAFNGLVVLMRACLAQEYERTGDPEYEAMRERTASLVKRITEELRWQSPVSLAIACLGGGSKGWAIAHLEEACLIGDPLMVWLHLWPIFDSLREEPRFKALIKRMNLPG